MLHAKWNTICQSQVIIKYTLYTYKNNFWYYDLINLIYIFFLMPINTKVVSLNPIKLFQSINILK